MTAPALVLPSEAALPPLARAVRDAATARGDRQNDAQLSLTCALYSGDQWAGGRGWTGPLPDPVQGGAASVTSGIERVFVSRNMLRDVVQRHQSGVAGREPLWTIAPRRLASRTDQATESERAATDEFSAALTGWWDAREVWPAVQRAVRTALWSGRGTLRLFVPAAELVNGRVPQEALANTLRRIHVQAPEWTAAGVLRDDDGVITAAYHHYTQSAHVRLELHERQGGETVVHPSVGAAGTDLLPPNRYPVSGLLIYELRLDPLITPSIVSLQKLYNKTWTMLSRNVDVGGFVETTILNAQMPGKWTVDPLTKERSFEPAPYNKGAGVVQFLTGAAVMQPDPSNPSRVVPTGQLATPSVVHRDPVKVATFTDTLDATREAIFDEARQLHVLINGDASASGVSRQQAVNDFMTSLEPTRIALENLMRWLLTTALELGLHFAGRAGELEDYRVRVQARLSAVQPSAAEIESTLKVQASGAISEETAMGRLGVEDIDAERATRAAEGITPALVRVLSDAGAPEWVVLRALQLAYPALGLTDEDVQAQRELDLASGVPAGAGGMDGGGNSLPVDQVPADGVAP